MPQFITEGDLRAIVGSVIFGVGVLCYWYCAFKCIKCLKKKEGRRNIIIVSPRQDHDLNV